MKKNPYHIDVTPEEDMLFRDIVKPEPQEKRFKMLNLPIVAGVILVHFAGVAVLFGSPKKEPSPQLPEPTPTPVPVVNNSLENTPKVVAVPQPSPVKKAGEGSHPSITSTYTVKSGDTFYSIVRKFKLNPQNLIKLNSIEDPAKLKTGQVLKFVK